MSALGLPFVAFEIPSFSVYKITKFLWSVQAERGI